jgi:putative ABC transport system permease protein
LVRVDDLDRIDEVVAALAGQLGPDYEVESWKSLRPNIADVIRFQQIIVRIVALVFLVIVIFGVINTMVMSVLERTREIGTMLAVGVRRRQVSLLFLLEAAFLAVLGGGLGAAAGRLVVWAIGAAGGIRMAAPGQTEERFNLVPMVPAGLIQMTVIGATAGALLAALYPAWRASRLRPVDALRAA